MQGTLSEFSLAELLQLFALAERTGAIAVQSSGSSTRVFLESGRIVGLGEDTFNVHREIVACELLPARSGAALESVTPTSSPRGLSFIVKNLIEPERWDLFVRRCLEQELYPLLSAKQGSFQVTVGHIPPCPLTLAVAVQQLVLDGSRWEAEMEEHRLDGFGPTSAWRRLEAPGSASMISSVDWLVWAILEEAHSLRELARRLCVPELDATSAVRRLHSSGVLSEAG